MKLPADLDPRGEAAQADPCRVWHELRTSFPVAEIDLPGRRSFVVSRHCDVVTLSTHRSSRQRPIGGGVPAELGDGAGARMFAASMSQSDPPRHALLRRAAARAFGPSAVAEMRSGVEQVVSEAFDELGDEVEIVGSLAQRIPMTVICRLLDIGTPEWDAIIDHTPDALRMFMPSASSPDELRRCDDACEFFFELLGGMIRTRRSEPGADLLSSIVAANDDEGELTDDELVGVTRGLLTAGYETTASTIAAWFHALSTDPGLPARVRESSGDLGPVVDELLRWESPVRAQPRYIHEAVEVSGVELPAGSALWLLFGAANHDERVFGTDTDRLVVGREAGQHVAFGSGRHVCLGAGLARLELAAVIRATIERFADVEAQSAPVRRHHLQFSSIASFPVRLRRHQ